MARLSADGTALEWATFLGGSDNDNAYAVTLDVVDRPVLVGETSSFNFPTTPGSYDQTLANNRPMRADAFVARLSADGTTLEWATYLGGNADTDKAYGVVLDASGRPIIVGETGSSDFPATSGAYDETYNGGSRDAFVARLSVDGTALEWATYLGGSGYEDSRAVVLDIGDRLVLAGGTASSDFPATSGAYDETYNGGSRDAFVAQLSNDGTTLEWATYLGGSSWSNASEVRVDTAGRPVVVGDTGSSDFPTTSGAYDETYSGGSRDAFVARLSADGTALEWATFLGGNQYDWGYGMALDQAGRPVVVGDTGSSDFPATSGAYDETYNGGSFSSGGDAFVARLSADGTTLEWATFLGGGDSEDAKAVVLDEDGHAVVAGATCSSNFPVTSGAYDQTYSDGDVFVARMLPPGGEEVSVIVSPAIFLSSALLDPGTSLTISGLGFAPLGNALLTVNGPTGFTTVETTVTADASGRFSYPLTIALTDPAGTYSVSLRDETTGKTSSSKRFVVNEVNPTEELPELIMTAPLQGTVYPSGQPIPISFTDFARGGPYPEPVGTQRAYHYRLEYRIDGGGWLIQTDVIGQARFDAVATITSTLTLPPGTIQVRVIDADNLQRVAEGESFIVVDAEEDGASVSLEWDYSFDTPPVRPPAGVSTDGVSRLYLRVDPTEGSVVERVDVALSSPGNTLTTSAQLGKLQRATIIDAYDDEANDADTTMATSNSPNEDGAYWFWYVAPDDPSLGQDELSRVVTATVTVTFQGAPDATVLQNIEVRRPPLVLVHGWNSDSDTWKRFSLDDMFGRRYSWDPRYPISKALSMDPGGSFLTNAYKLTANRFDQEYENASIERQLARS
ncbi:MAG: hypothetical protein AAFR95_15740, partial [Bacteroidota bacterium]